MEQSIVLEYKSNAIKMLFKKSFDCMFLYIYYAVYALLAAIFGYFYVMNANDCDCLKFSIGILFLLFLPAIMAIILFSIITIPAYVGIKKFKKISFNKEYLFIGKERYNIQDIQIKVKDIKGWRIPLVWTYIFLYHKDKLLAMFISEVNGYKFFGIDSRTIANFINKIKDQTITNINDEAYESLQRKYEFELETRYYNKAATLLIFAPAALILLLILIFLSHR